MWSALTAVPPFPRPSPPSLRLPPWSLSVLPRPQLTTTGTRSYKQRRPGRTHRSCHCCLSVEVRDVLTVSGMRTNCERCKHGATAGSETQAQKAHCGIMACHIFWTSPFTVWSNIRAHHGTVSSTCTPSTGAGADCRKFGPGNVCKDATWPGYTCAKGLVCARQDQYYHQCVAPDRNNINTDGRYNVQAIGGNTATRPQGQVQQQTSVNSSSGGAAQAKPATNASATNRSVTTTTTSSSSTSNKALVENEQCGGRGAKCGQSGYGGCADAQFSGYACGQGLTCKRQNQWYWQVRKHPSTNHRRTA